MGENSEQTWNISTTNCNKANPFYCGIIRVKRTGKTYLGKHQKIIPVALYEKTQNVRSGRVTKKKTKHNFCYRGLFRCNLCGSSMIAEKQRGHIYYRCQVQSCETKTIREEVIEASLMNLFDRFRFSLEDQNRLKAGLREWIRDHENPAVSKDTFSFRLGNIEEREMRLTDALLDGVIDRDVFKTRQNALLIEKQKCREEMEKYDDPATLQADIERFLEHVTNLGLTFQNLNQNEKREFTKYLTSNRAVERKNVVLQPQKWLHTLEFLNYVPLGCPRHDTNRTCAFDVKGVFGSVIEHYRE